MYNGIWGWLYLIVGFIFIIVPDVPDKIYGMGCLIIANVYFKKE